MKRILLLVSALALSTQAHAQSAGQTPTVRYEGRPVEDIVRNGVPTTNTLRNDRVIVTERDRIEQQRQWQERQRQEEQWRGRDGRHWPEHDRWPQYGAYPPMLSQYMHIIREPWRYNLPDRGPRHVWVWLGNDAVLYDVRTRYPVYLWRGWFR